MRHRRQPVGRAFFAGYVAANRLYRKGFSLLASGAFAEFGSNSVVSPPVRIEGIDRISIGSRVFVDSGCWLHVEGDGLDVAMEIGDDTSVGSHAVFSAVRSIRIGKRVAFGRNVYMSDHSHGFENAEVPVADQAVANIRPVKIGDGAWLGENAVILPGVQIGRGAVIGANSVVNIDVPDGGIAVGVPARVIRVRSAHDGEDVGATTAGVSPRVTD
jgi:acetyltransferase-like isoleucine patch superfamily enzyme